MLLEAGDGVKPSWAELTSACAAADDEDFNCMQHLPVRWQASNLRSCVADELHRPD